MSAIKVLGALITLPIIFLLPGFALFKSRLFREYDMHWLAKLLFIIVVSASLTSLLALGFAELGYLRIWLLDIILVAVTLATRMIFGYTGRPVFMGATRREVLVVVAICIIGIGLFFRPFEVIIGDGDPGYYFNTGYHLAETGNINIYEPTVPAMSDQELNTFYARAILQFNPFHLRVRSTGKVQPLLYHLISVWMGMFIILFGTWGGLYVVPLLLLLSVLIVYSIVRRFGNAFGAAAAGGLMVFSFLEVYFARLPVSEAACQFFVLAAILFYAEYSQTKGPATALASAGAATAAFLMRPEVLLIAVPMLVVEAVEVFRDRFTSGDLVFTNALLLGLLYTWLYIRFVAYQYLSTNIVKVVELFGRNGLSRALDLCLALVVVAIVLFNLPFFRRLCARAGKGVAGRLKALSAVSGKVVAIGIAGLTLLMFLYMYVVMPLGTKQVESSKNFFFYAAGYFGGIAVFMFVVGLCLFLYESPSVNFAFVLGSSVILLTVVFAQSHVTSAYQPWLVRRFMTVLVPALFIGFGYLAGRLWAARRTWLRAAVGVAIILTLAFFVYLDAPLVNFVQFKGVDKQIKAIADKAGGDVVIFTDPYDGEAIGVPLRYKFHVDARVAYRLDAGVDFPKTVRDYVAKGRKVLIETKGLTMLRPDNAVLDTLSLEKAFDATVSFKRMHTTYKVIPRGTGTETHDITFYYVIPKT